MSLHAYRVHWSYQGEAHRGNRVSYVLSGSVIDAATLVKAHADKADVQVWQVVHIGRIDLVDHGAVEAIGEIQAL